MGAKLSVLIIEDEPKAQFVLQSLLVQKCDQFVHVVGVASSVEEAVILIQNLHPDLVFFDIQLGNQSSFDVFKHIDHVDFQTVFVTAYAQFALDAFEVGALQYLVKPIQTKKLVQVVHTVYQNWISSEKLLCIKQNAVWHKIHWNEIMSISSEKPYIAITTVQGKRFLYHESMKNISKEMPQHFIQVHRAHIVNLHYTIKFNFKLLTCLLINEVSVPISHRRVAELKSYI
jgi:two-component system LytT family response regulator